ncbi:MAG: hypothetical protein GQ525_03870, partial [Draconibacterium sp.]|nr:hypothetical protein [Draconibacterium sp.]
MQREKNISTRVQNYIKGESTREELKEAISLFEDPYHNIGLRPVLFNLWNSDKHYDLKQPETKNLSDLLNQIHHKINLEECEARESNTKKFIINISKIAAILIIGA